MSAAPNIQCTECGYPYPKKGLPFQCPLCGGLFDYSGLPTFDLNQMEVNLPGIWRYRHAFDLLDGVPVLSMGEGNTPLVWDSYRGFKIGLKLESLNPSGSYKDRAMCLILAHIISRGICEAVEDSSGNAGASFAAYAARAGIKGTVFVPDHLSEAKARQIEIYGAALNRIAGARSAAAKAVMETASRGAAYASHAYLPFGKRGIATIAYELWAQSGFQSPGTIVAPVGHGHLLMGIIEGFEALRSADLIAKVPYFVGVQAESCPPIYRAWLDQEGAPSVVSETHTLAEGVSVSTPKQGKQLLQYMTADKGRFYSVDESNILTAFHELAERGFYVEHTSALVWVALEHLYEELPQPVVLILTGSGLKTTIEY